MKLTYSSFKDEDIFHLTDFRCNPAQSLFKEKNLYKILWNRSGTVEIGVDDYRLELKENEVIFCTPLNIMEVPIDNEALLSFVFNKQFFCIQSNDDQVSCNGFLFFGSAQPQVITLSESEEEAFKLIHRLFVHDLAVKDHLQGEMLRSLLKRLLISSTRILEQNLPGDVLPKPQLDTIRNYNILVEKHFKEYHQVKDYATLLHKSPKTLSNLFSKHIEKSPLSIINERIILEAKRLILYSDKSNEEIAQELGYKDAGHFSKFFKKHVGNSPTNFKKIKLLTPVN